MVENCFGTAINESASKTKKQKYSINILIIILLLTINYHRDRLMKIGTNDFIHE